MQAIVTKYHGPRNVRGSRISATAQAGRLYVEYDDALNSEENHIAAAHALSARLGWNVPPYGRMVSGTLPDGRMCHVFTE